jgi:hypothetical protein
MIIEIFFDQFLSVEDSSADFDKAKMPAQSFAPDRARFHA